MIRRVQEQSIPVYCWMKKDWGLKLPPSELIQRVKLLKYADNTTIVGLITKNMEDDYRSEIDRMVNMCKDHNLILNESKTVELIIDSRTNTSIKTPIIINDQSISATDSFKFLGTHINNKLNGIITPLTFSKQQINDYSTSDNSGNTESGKMYWYNSTPP
ncbi:hypothetical protein XNOV1_A021650 [Xyrichtys novacula]|uniref:Reverse transcriptase domain-containing protein n=1 Tax=Xyrichtys novacula TaxID=13765 RepID=A0AAV1H869_XYRNO|nr:hypothetical protein XNOV1_A021650 [Xyrichtys novacula]